MGVVGLTVPETDGGLGLGLVDLVLLLEEAGRAGLPEPLLETTALAVPVLAHASSARADELRAQWLPSVAAGDAVLTVATEDMPLVPGALSARLLLLQRHRRAARGAGRVDRPDSARPALDGARRAGRGHLGAVTRHAAGLG